MRVDYSLGNPNEAATLFTAAGGLILHIFLRQKRGLIPALAITIIVLILIWPTWSRSGLGLYFISFSTLWASSSWVTSRHRVYGLIFVVTGFLICITFSGICRRIAVRPDVDQSLLCRVNMWRAAPAMIAANPLGWGRGNSGKAYCEWFEDLSDDREYGHLISAHLTAIVEYGLCKSLLYLFLWAFALAICWPSAERGLVGCLHAIGCYYCEAFVEPAYESLTSKIFIIGVIGLAFLIRIFRKKKINFTLLVSIAGCQVFLVMVLLITGHRQSLLEVKNGNACYGSGPQTVLVCGTADVLGNMPGRVLRKADIDLERLRFTIMTNDCLVRSDYRTVVLAGNVDRTTLSSLEYSVAHVDRVVILNPKFAKKDLPSLMLQRAVVFAGEFWDRVNPDWETSAIINIVPGCDEFIRRWPDIAAAEKMAINE